MTVVFDGFTIDWLGYATARVAGVDGTVVYTDPGRYGVLDGYDARDGDVVLVTHDHHYDTDGIRRVASSEATVVVFDAVDPTGIDRAVDPVDALPYDCRHLEVGETLVLFDGAVAVEATPAQNVPPERGSHTPGFGCGYRFTVDGRSVFWPGDTDYLDALESVDASILLANIGGGPVMDRHDAADLAEAIGPDLVVPIHYDTIPMLETDAAAFAADVAGRSIPVALDGP